MHFDIRLWRLMAGLRGQIALGIVLGLLALAVESRGSHSLGSFLRRLFRAEPAAALIVPLVATLVAIVLRPWLDHVRTMIAHRTAMRVQDVLRASCTTRSWRLGRRGSAPSAPAG